VDLIFAIMTTTKRKSRFTRSQRRKLYTFIAALFMAITLVVGWGTWSTSWVRNDPGTSQSTINTLSQDSTYLGIRTRQLGLYP